ncbi:MAG: aminomethyl-transferring glycine dehydrogenase subunit GcvPB, partial [Phenylobacterium sp.]
MSLNSVGRPTRPVAEATAAGFASLTGGRGLLQDEALIFERESWNGTGVDLPAPEAGTDDLGG